MVGLLNSVGTAAEGAGDVLAGELFVFVFVFVSVLELDFGHTPYVEFALH